MSDNKQNNICLNKEALRERFSKNIRAIITYFDFSDSEFARKIDWNYKTFKSYLDGVNLPNPYFIEKVCQVFGYSIENFCSDDFVPWEIQKKEKNINPTFFNGQYYVYYAFNERIHEGLMQIKNHHVCLYLTKFDEAKVLIRELEKLNHDFQEIWKYSRNMDAFYFGQFMQKGQYIDITLSSQKNYEDEVKIYGPIYYDGIKDQHFSGGIVFLSLRKYLGSSVSKMILSDKVLSINAKMEKILNVKKEKSLVTLESNDIQNYYDLIKE